LAVIKGKKGRLTSCMGAGGGERGLGHMEEKTKKKMGGSVKKKKAGDKKLSPKGEGVVGGRKGRGLLLKSWFEMVRAPSGTKTVQGQVMRKKRHEKQQGTAKTPGPTGVWRGSQSVSYQLAKLVINKSANGGRTKRNFLGGDQIEGRYMTGTGSETNTRSCRTNLESSYKGKKHTGGAKRERTVFRGNKTKEHWE